MGTSEPPAKSFMDSDVTIDFSDAAIINDRVLLVDGKKFHVQSSLLSQFSEFFNGLFNSNFKEKNEETIELKDITADDFDNFLRALYPIRFKATVDNLASLMQLSIRFLCPTVWSLCLEYLKNKDQFKKFSPRELLQWSEGSDSQELKTLIENELIEKNRIFQNQQFQEMEECLSLSEEYGLNKLKVVVDNFLISSDMFKQNNLKQLTHLSHTFELENLKVKLEETLIKKFELWDLRTNWVLAGLDDLLLDRMAFFREKVKLKLRRVVEFYPRPRERQYLQDIFGMTNVDISANIEVIMSDMFVREEVKRKVLDKYCDIALAYNLELLKLVIVDYLEESLKQSKSLEEIVVILEIMDKYEDGINIKKKIDTAIETMFNNDKSMSNKDVLSNYLAVTVKQNLVQVKASVEEYLIKECGTRKYYHYNDFIFFINEFHLDGLRDHFDHQLCTNCKFDDNMILLHTVLITVQNCKLPEFEAKVSVYMYQQVNDFHRTNTFRSLELANTMAELKFWVAGYLCNMYKEIHKSEVAVETFLQIAVKYNIDQLQKHISAKLEEDFWLMPSLKPMNLAFRYNLQGLKELIAAYLIRINSSELSEEDKQIILNATPEVKDFVLRNLLKG